MGPTEQEYRQAIAWIESLRARVMQLESENGDLRRQLDELRRGVGMAVIIQGRAVPLAVPLAAPTPASAGYPLQQASAPAAFPSPVSQPMPSLNGQTSLPIAPLSARQHPPAAPLSAPINSAARPGAVAPRYPENTWLTGQMPVAHPEGGAAGGQRENDQRRQTRPSQRVTPEWLREETQGSYGASQQAPVPRTTAQMPATGQSPAARARPRGGTPARPLGSQESPERLPSLAELTGHMPAVRGRPRLSKRERDEYDDSFVLG